MASLKSLKTRIVSVKSTRKITHAMQIVSGTKLKKARKALDANKPYSEEVERLAEILINQLPEKQDYPLLCQKAVIKHALILVIGSEKGLCGAFNSSLAKAVKQKAFELHQSGIAVSVVCIGAKVYSILKHIPDVQVELRYDNAQMLIKESEQFAHSLISQFLSGQIDVSFICYNKFVNALKRDLIVQQFVPLSFVEQDVSDATRFEFEPEVGNIMHELVSYLIVGRMLSALFESKVSEDAARMTAMDNATRNASEIIKRLTSLYNRTRQAAVTTELTEIIAGAESVK